LPRLALKLQSSCPASPVTGITGMNHHSQLILPLRILLLQSPYSLNSFVLCMGHLACSHFLCF
jgi:hypothetical protein